MGNPRAQALCYNALGGVEHLVGRWPESMADSMRSIELFQSVGSTFGVVMGMNRVAMVETALGRYDVAHDRLRRALALVEVSDNPMVVFHSPTRLYTSLADNRLRAGDLGGARSYLANGYTAQEEVVAQGFGECVSCDVLLYPAAVAVHLASGDLDRAELDATNAERATTWFHSPVWLATARHLRGLLAEARGKPRFAAECFEQAIAVFRELDQPYDLATCLDAFARVTGDPRVRQEARRLYRRLGSTPLHLS